MRILAMDTSNQSMSVAIIENNQILVEKTTNVKRNHSIQLMPTIEHVIEDANLSIDSLDRIVVAKGPGSYTGVRIAVTVAKTLAWTKEIELVGISSLKVIAGNAQQIEGSLIVPVMDARRGNIYTGLYTYKNQELIELERDRHVSAKEWAQELASKHEIVQMIGTDLEKHLPIFKPYLKENLLLLPSYQQLPRASVLAMLGAQEEPTDIHTFVPEYAKLTEAEENWKEANPNDLGGRLIEKY
ncbi:tRNA (adenosine(37)-N6)-threonylcarbamoyltransferase complex dimerization subunit type 1 TsaB [Marinilactibacillus psychrotolerans]|uniref:tRNA threonylcarbamoyladenosine biosynthesis protein TsaB n=1 Tax=Marinilactibacillus psychrotolerans TaxID=191770 RepID=A0AAV3WU19_9LACT|nr:tRNA (adenosine(37)-N6)-threonylcarbamoyltransferase complex dimerization subunit type 1 TsaB [Marinilactibacillus psychrotolerans]GEL66684.1 tRNA (adenosine(37)-N6)-threonylcarbamoyltransferase complex dimerization subunit type 1 TsaB [Marinilactibacillus psychrotolerans]GEQ35206.1 tRNA threonylcarbamoyladenosine biosynthesis protein TsaB [Marinilactibacillus psychrotolerans]SDD24430.1 tRNA threonylcarbamoyladenosine biosynthesis protein TsaB [Marinilactibacillus psychrotolerans]